MTAGADAAAEEADFAEVLKVGQQRTTSQKREAYDFVADLRGDIFLSQQDCDVRGRGRRFRCWVTEGVRERGGYLYAFEEDRRREGHGHRHGATNTMSITWATESNRNCDNGGVRRQKDNVTCIRQIASEG